MYFKSNFSSNKNNNNAKSSIKRNYNWTEGEKTNRSMIDLKKTKN